jgi:hypothetical protein
MKKKLLFVTYLDEDPADGLSYVINLAKILHEDLTIFLLYKKDTAKKFNNMMTTVTFAETGERKADVSVKDRERVNGKYFVLLVGKCRESGINVDIQPFKSDVVPALEDYFKWGNGIDMVLLGPNITDKGVSSRELKKLLHTVSRPIVTMARQSNTVSG